MHKNRILYIIDTLNTGGAEISLVDIAVRNQETESFFITLYKFKNNELVNVLKKNNIPVFTIDCNKKYGFNSIKKKLVPLIKDIEPDIIHTTLYRSEIIMRSLKNRFSIPLIGSFVSNSYGKHKIESLSFFIRIKHKLLKIINILTAKKVDLFISNSNSIKYENAKQLKISLDRIKVIYRGRDPLYYENISDERAKQFKEKNNLKKNKIILSVGRLRKSKGFSDLIGAFNKIHKDFYEWKLVIAGDGPFKEELIKLINLYQINDRVILLGNRDDIPVILKASDLFVFPSHLEGLPGALIEAMFAKKTILCSDIPENKECVTDNEAIIFKTGDMIDLSNKLKKLLTDINEYTYLGNNANSVAHQKFDIYSVIKQYNKIYNDVINSFKR